MASMWMPDGSREVEVITLLGRQVLKVRDPRRAYQPLYSAGYVRPRYVRDGGGQLVLSPGTVKELADMGVDMAQLVAERPAAARAEVIEHPAITRRPGETVAAWNRRKYDTSMGRLLADLDKRRAA